MPDLTHHLATLGPFAILVGSAVEGQLSAMAGGVMAREHLMSPLAVFAAAVAGTALVDYILFVLGRSFRRSGFVTKASKRRSFAKAVELIERFPTGFILSFRFIYGLRAAGPVAIGVTRIGHRRFAVLNVVGALIWATVCVGLGYLIGPALMTLMHSTAGEAAPIVVAALFAAVIAGVLLWRRRGKDETPESVLD
ncbi:DedA family protein [Phenylobacterium sp.]|uniref:DedA family protein n=1 Tax=Phenylobacterium sp. TaxID=1871053 RepID=UPI0025F65420|nr:DedA family protein [Phenylobacterium sp.]MBX3485058.1 DedA family protein [Phenylobacterium sp.]MCW5758954.1 DedA family protein [Phenylobacterium sp.]